MSNSTTLSNNATEACPRIAGLWARVPSAWTDRNSENFTQMACTAPACNNYPSTLASCCGRSQGDLQTFDTDVGPYVSCALSVNDTAEYTRYQQCLLTKFVSPFICNEPTQFKTSGRCVSNAIETSPVSAAEGQQECSLPTNPNATRALLRCCSNADDGAGIVPYGNGCYQSCVSNSTSTDGRYLRCINDALGAYQPVLCSVDDARNGSSGGDDSSAGGRALPSLAGLVTALLAMSSTFL